MQHSTKELSEQLRWKRSVHLFQLTRDADFQLRDCLYNMLVYCIASDLSYTKRTYTGRAKCECDTNYYGPDCSYDSSSFTILVESRVLLLDSLEYTLALLGQSSESVQVLRWLMPCEN
jgi:hypothetical protein